MTARLNVNIDHVATVRQARRAPEPSVVAAAMMCEEAGADGITVHLRGDRRHIQDEDIYNLRRVVTTYLNVEMAATDEMIAVATDARPDAVTPEITEFNIGHNIVARAVLNGLAEAVREMRARIREAKP